MGVEYIVKKIMSVKTNTMFPIIKEMIKNGNSVRITVTGMSMYPFLRENIDSVELTSPNFYSIKKGDIIMIQRDNNQYVMHRVFKIKKNCFYIVGDAQQWIEGPLRPNQIVAVINTVWRNNKRIDCSNIIWKTLAKAWLSILPCRTLLINFYNKFRLLTYKC